MLHFYWVKYRQCDGGAKYKKIQSIELD